MQTKTQSRIEKVAGAYYLIVEGLAKDLNTGEWVVVETQEPQKLTNADGGAMNKEQVKAALEGNRQAQIDQRKREDDEFEALLASID